MSTPCVFTLGGTVTDTTIDGDWVMVGSAGMMRTVPSSRVTRVIGPETPVAWYVLTDGGPVVAVVAGGVPGAVVVVPATESLPRMEPDDVATDDIVLSPIGADVSVEAGRVASGSVDSDEAAGSEAEQPAVAKPEPRRTAAANRPSTGRGRHIVMDTPGK